MQLADKIILQIGELLNPFKYLNFVAFVAALRE